MYIQIEEGVRELESQGKAETKGVNEIIAQFHISAGHLMEVIGDQDKAMDHFEKAYALLPLEWLEQPGLIIANRMPMLDVRTVRGAISREGEKLLDGDGSPGSIYSFGLMSLRFAEALEEKRDSKGSEAVLRRFVGLLKESKSLGSDDMSRIVHFLASQAWELLADEEEAMESLRRASEISKSQEASYEGHGDNSYDRGLWFEETGAIFERLDPTAALEYYDKAESCYRDAVKRDEYPDDYYAPMYALEFSRQLGPQAHFLAADVFLRLAFRRQRLLAAIEGEAGYPIRMDIANK